MIQFLFWAPLSISASVSIVVAQFYSTFSHFYTHYTPLVLYNGCFIFNHFWCLKLTGEKKEERLNTFGKNQWDNKYAPHTDSLLFQCNWLHLRQLTLDALAHISVKENCIFHSFSHIFSHLGLGITFIVRYSPSKIFISK